jgi:hypothetical protein
MEKKQKLLFILALVISNCFTYLLFFTPSNNEIKERRLILREDYQKLKIKALVKTPLKIGYPIAITTTKYQEIVKDIFFLGYPNQNAQEEVSLEISQSEESGILIEVPKAKALEILKMKKIVVVPFDFSISKFVKRINHEVNY